VQRIVSIAEDLSMSLPLPIPRDSGLRLAYLVVEARRPARWARFCDAMLGLPEPVDNLDGSRGWRIDSAAQRLIVREGRADDLAALGFDCGDEGQLDALLARLRQRGIAVTDGDAQARAARRVRRLHRLQDPAGNVIELVVGPAQAGERFVSAAVPGGYRAGELGLGHAALVAHDLAAMERFYVEALGFGVSERLAARAGPIEVRGVFLHCNVRHHSLALMDLPLRKRLHHFMLQVNDWRDVGLAYERARREKVPLSLDLGQHPDPDGTFSFYGITPSGFDFEIGGGGRDIDPAQWQVLRADVTSTWGHRPQWRTQLRIATGLVGRLWRGPAAATGG
jgi:2,3-dihydroxybiphenyl 1,2-dioxygenase